LKFKPRTVTVPPEYTSGGLNALVLEKIAEFNTVNAKEPAAVFTVDIVMLFGLLQETLNEHDPGKTKELIVVIIIVSDRMLHDTAGTLQTIAEQF
jgi:hypothetical protein